MALVFPVVHDPDGSEIKVWETLSSTADTGSPAETNPIPDAPPPNGYSSEPIRHNGKITLQYDLYIGDGDFLSRVVSRNSNGTWDILGAAEDFGYVSATTYVESLGIYSFDGSLYAAVQVEGASFNHKVRIFKYNASTNVWEDQTDPTTGLSNQTGNFGGGHGKFFVLGGELHFKWEEVRKIGLNPATYHLVIAKLNSGSWSRVTSTQVPNNISGASNDQERASGAVVGNAFFTFHQYNIYRYTTANGLEIWSSGSTSVSGGERTAPFSNTNRFGPANLSMESIDGDAIAVFWRLNQATAFFQSEMLSTTGTFSVSSINFPSSPYGSSYLQPCDVEEGAGGTYYLFSIESATAANRGLIVYRRDGSSWTEIGGGRFIQNDNFRFHAQPRIRIFGSAIYVFCRSANNAQTSASYVISRIGI